MPFKNLIIVLLVIAAASAQVAAPVPTVNGTATDIGDDGTDLIAALVSLLYTLLTQGVGLLPSIVNPVVATLNFALAGTPRTLNSTAQDDITNLINTAITALNDVLEVSPAGSLAAINAVKPQIDYIANYFEYSLSIPPTILAKLSTLVPLVIPVPVLPPFFG